MHLVKLGGTIPLGVVHELPARARDESTRQGRELPEKGGPISPFSHVTLKPIDRGAGGGPAEFSDEGVLRWFARSQPAPAKDANAGDTDLGTNEPSQLLDGVSRPGRRVVAEVAALVDEPVRPAHVRELNP